jgi:hypothetical protein
MMEAARTSETSVDNHFTRQYNPEDSSEHRLRVFENRVLRRIFGSNRGEVTGEWRKLHSEDLYILYSSPNIITQIKSRQMRWAGRVVRIGKERKVYKVLVRKPKGNKNHSKDQGVDGSVGSDWNFFG